MQRHALYMTFFDDARGREPTSDQGNSVATADHRTARRRGRRLAVVPRSGKRTRDAHLSQINPSALIVSDVFLAEEERMIRVQWSQTLIAQTRARFDRDAPGRDGWVALKNVDGRFGLCGCSPSTDSRLDVWDRLSGQLQEYESVDALTADGWAID
jgi:hypothetical protein